MTRSGAVPQRNPGGGLNLVRLSVPARAPAVSAKRYRAAYFRKHNLPGNPGHWLLAKRLPTQAFIVQRE
jgi:hypothetical protein